MLCEKIGELSLTSKTMMEICMKIKQFLKFSINCLLILEYTGTALDFLVVTGPLSEAMPVKLISL